MSAVGQYGQGPVEYKRDYALWLLILLVIICWPAAIVYYFTRPKIAVQRYQPYQSPMGTPIQGGQAPPAAYGSAGRFCPACGAAGQTAGGVCTACGKPIPP